MKTVSARLRGIASYSQSRHYDEPKLQGESDQDHYKRTWRGHLHLDKNDLVLMPSTQLKNCLANAAKFLSMKIPGQGQNKYTKHFEAGVMCLKSHHLLVQDADKKEWVTINKKDVECEALFLSPSGERGGKKRVLKYYPVFTAWAVDAEFYVIDDTCLQTCRNPKDAHDKEYTVFQKVLQGAGQFIGLGRFRAQMNGNYGRFVVEDFQVIDDGEASFTATMDEDEDDEDTETRPQRGRPRLEKAF